MKLVDTEVYEVSGDGFEGKPEEFWAAWVMVEGRNIGFWNGDRCRTWIIKKVTIDDDKRFRFIDTHGRTHEFRPLTLAFYNRWARAAGRQWTSLIDLKKALRS